MSFFRYRAELGCALALAFAVPLVTQDGRLDAEAKLVRVPVMVTGADGRPVNDLTGWDFQLLDNGRPQVVTVDSFSTGMAPVALAVAVQSSGISYSALEKVRDLGPMIQPLITGERGCAALVAFDDSINWLQECTSDPHALTLAFHKLRPGDDKSARMLDAVSSAIDRLSKRPNARRVLLLISESRDRGSESGLESIIVASQAAGIIVYATTYSAFSSAWTTRTSRPPPTPAQPPAATRPPARPPPGGQIPGPTPVEQRVDLLGAFSELLRLGQANTTKALVEATGGATFSFSRRRGLEEAIAKLGEELHGQYLLSFVPESPEPGPHRLEVLLPRHRGYSVRARPAYWSPSGSR